MSRVVYALIRCSLLSFVWIFALLATAPDAIVAADDVKLQFDVRVPDDHPADADVFVSGNYVELGPWAPDALKLQKGDDGRYRGELNVPKGYTLEYKFTCGSWETVEKGADGSELSNRQWKVDRDETIRIDIARWAKSRQAKMSTGTGDLRTLEIESVVFKSPRRLTVWLPAEYKSNPELRLDVLYLLDGQNVFDESRASFGVEWSADETAAELTEKRLIRPIMIVAIDHSSDRLTDYTPVAGMISDKKRAGGGADLFLLFLVSEVKPLIDRTFRTNLSPEHTAIGGSSLGGLFAIHAVRTRGDVFGNAISMSPSLMWGDESLLSRWEQEKWRPFTNQSRTKVWLDTGAKESAIPKLAKEHVERVNRLAKAWSDPDIASHVELGTKIDERGEHNEAAWARRLPLALEFVFGGTPQ